MKSDIWIGKKGFRYWYYRFRDSQYYAIVLIGLTIVACIALLFYVLMPELSNWFSIRKEIQATQQRIAVLQQNISFMNTLDKGTLNTQLQVTSHALPPEKDFGSMLQALSRASENSGVSLNNYSFQVGDIASSTNRISDVNYKGLASIQISVVVNGNIDGIRRFIKSLESSLPISEVTNINGSGNNVSITMQFYQKPFPPINFSGDTPLSPVSAKKLGLIQKLSQWDTSSATQARSVVQQSASNSAVPLF